jgi:hypothetical protein
LATKTRILGQDVQIRLSRGGNPLTTITAIKSFNFETRTRILTEGYLGEVAQRQDSIFDEVGGTFMVHPESTDLLVFQKFLVDRAIRRQASDEQVVITFRISFPNGQVARIVVPSPEFDPVNFNSSARDAYVDTTFTYKSDQYSLFV